MRSSSWTAILPGRFRLVHPLTSLGRSPIWVMRKFWFESFQNWQSEFLSTAVLVVLSIFLRYKNSPESKPVGAAHSDTGA